jgi:CRISPR-associated endonuclease/helicase Cas3
MRSARVAKPLPRPLAMVRMSATPAERPSDVFAIGPKDRENSVLAARLRTKKRAELCEVATPRDPARARDAIAKACVAEVERVVAKSAAVRVAVLIVNRVDTARRAAVLAGDRLGSAWDVELMTGRMRPLDRADLERRLLPRVAAEPGRRTRRAETDQRLLLVSTQAIEAGADFDFDALVTECASLDALRQRFGRLDRLGELEAAPAAIVAGSADVAEGAEPDPVYGESLARTFRWLVEQARQSGEEPPAVDFGNDALDARLSALGIEERARLLSPRPVAPVLLPSHLDRWVQTWPRPSADPDVAPFLHGTERGAPDVYIVWRGDVSKEQLRAAASDAIDEQALKRERDKSKGQLRAAASDAGAGSGAVPASVLAMLDVAPPSALEALAVPLWAAQSWLADLERRAEGGEALPAPPVADVEGEKDEQAPGARLAPAIAWRGEKTRVVVEPSEVLPGDTLVVPSAYGGLGARFSCWDPASPEYVADRGDEAQLLHRARAVVRLGPEVLRGWNLDGNLSSGPRLNDDDEDQEPDSLRDAFESWRVAVLSAEQTPAWARLALGALGQGYELVGEGSSWACFSRRRVPRGDLGRLVESLAWNAALDGMEPATEDDGSSFTDVDVTLSRHLAGVRDFARGFARALALDTDLGADVELAGWLHDLGKADPRFQLMLHGGDPVAEAVADELLAKSKVALRSRAARERLQNTTRYPRGARHELMSVALIEHSEAIRARAKDWELVLHLVASHHGYCRPFAPPVLDPDPRDVTVELDGVRLEASSDHRLIRVDSLVAERFWVLVERYGFWGLAWLEAIVRLADHRESEKEAGHG